MKKEKLQSLITTSICLVILFFLLLGFSGACTNNVTKHPVKADTARVWLTFFKQVKPEFLDTSTFAIRIAYDTLIAKDTGNIIKKVWYRDTIYYVPVDTLKRNPKDSTKFIKDRMMILLPKGWDIMDYPKQFVPLITHPSN